MEMKQGILLMNTGSPDAPEEQAVRRYLREFLMDPHVLDLPWPLRAMIVYGAILPRRPALSAKAYKSIWKDNGSPLVYHCTQLAEQLQEQTGMPVAAGMAYGSPSTKDGINQLIDAGVTKIKVLPLFPQYAIATIGACVAKVKKYSPVQIEVVTPFYKHPAFTHPLAEKLKGINEHVLFSYHGLPVRHLQKTDPTDSHCMITADCCKTDSPAHATCYRHQCFETTKSMVAEAGLSDDQYTVSFQSRLGRAKWMEPYTEKMLRKLPENGVKNLAVICPAFFCDCLETLEEIDMRGREIFKNAGGDSFLLIPCLNSGSDAINCLAQLIG